jgi:hypothetical protein
MENPGYYALMMSIVFIAPANDNALFFMSKQNIQRHVAETYQDVVRKNLDHNAEIRLQILGLGQIDSTQDFYRLYYNMNSTHRGGSAIDRVMSMYNPGAMQPVYSPTNDEVLVIVDGILEARTALLANFEQVYHNRTRNIVTR